MLQRLQNESRHRGLRSDKKARDDTLEGRKSYFTLCLFTLASLQSILSMPRHYICKHLARIEFPMYLSILELKEICTGFGRETISFHIVESKFHSLFLHIDATANKVYLARYITVFHSINPKLRARQKDTLCCTTANNVLNTFCILPKFQYFSVSFHQLKKRSARQKDFTLCQLTLGPLQTILYIDNQS